MSYSSYNSIINFDTMPEKMNQYLINCFATTNQHNFGGDKFHILNLRWI